MGAVSTALSSLWQAMTCTSPVSPHTLDTAMLTGYTQRFSEFELHVRAILGFLVDVTMVSPSALVHSAHGYRT